jgi:hypothetical protein
MGLRAPVRWDLHPVVLDKGAESRILRNSPGPANMLATSLAKGRRKVWLLGTVETADRSLPKATASGRTGDD